MECDAAQVSVKEKIKKHSESYATRTDQPAHFTPLVTTTYGRLEDDFLRLLWLIVRLTIVLKPVNDAVWCPP